MASWPPAFAEPRSAPILIVEDDAPSLLIARRALEPLGQRLILAETGEEAIERSAQEDFAVILLDIGLPGVDGLEVARQLKRQERTRHTPLIFVTGQAYTDALVSRAYATGAADLLLKPFSPEVVRTKVHVFVELYLQRQYLAAQHEELLARTQALEHARLGQEAAETTLRELRRAHEWARLTEERYQLALRATNDVLWDWDLSTQEVRWNEALKRVLGHDMPEGVGGQCVTRLDWRHTLIHPEDSSRVEASLQAVLRGTDSAWECAYRIQRADGSWLDVLDRAFVARDARGHAVRVVGAMMNATERRRSEAERERLETIFSQAPVGIAILKGPRFVIELANPTICRLWGHTREQVLGRPHFEAIPESAGQGFEQLMEGVRTTGEPYVGRELPVKLRWREGAEPEQTYFNFVFEPLRDRHGQIEGIITVSSEVTEQVLARQRIEHIQAELEAIFESIPDAAYVGDPTGLKRANHRALDMLGYSSVEDLTRASIADLAARARVRDVDSGRLVPPGQTGLVKALAGEAATREFLVTHAATGRDVVIRSAASPVLLEGHVAAAVVINTDITEQRAVEARLRRSAEEFRTLAESLPQVVWTASPEGSITYVNSVLMRYTGLTQGTLIEGYPGKLHPEDEPHSRECWRHSLTTGEPLEVENRWRRHDGAWRWHLVRALPLHDTAGTVVRWLGTATDVHDLRQFQAELQRRVDFEQQLIGIVSHDLRNPLSAILLGTTSLTRRQELDSRSLQAVLRIRSSAERATRMIRDLLDFTQARLGGGIRIERGPADLHRVTRGVLEEIEATHSEREVELHCTGDGSGDWDEDRVAQVVQNLITNALKYSPADTHVRVETSAEEHHVVLRVHNWGPPLSSERREHLFEPLRRAADEVDKAGRSVGLGLYIVDQLVRAHGGQVTVDSSAERGTTFTVRLPRLPPAAQDP